LHQPLIRQPPCMFGIQVQFNWGLMNQVKIPYYFINRKFRVE
jgi:hypothetical protein